MGFCDLAMFNDSLLAKQAWRLLHNKTSLYYRVFKAKFFPHCSIMEANDSSARSYAWKSILKGRDVIHRGSRWWVGDGREIKIWQHHWLPIKRPPMIQSPIIDSMEEAPMDILIDAKNRRWNIDLVDGHFAPQEAEIIK